MSYEVLARKWRPRQFEDVVGQGHVTQTLRNALTSGRLAHAYLFVGPRGIGKTSIARIFAKALNCERGMGPSPCDQCDSCREIAGGNSLDVMEFDAASNTQVDKVRELIIDSVKFRPSRGRFKVYIVDEVHMLSSSSFNALLKTLEEPPAHVKFLFATTEPQKIPLTIISRCQRFDLRRIHAAEIVARLREIAAAEKIDIDEDALGAIARGAEGGLRDAESALDQLISFKGTTIREPDVLSVFGVVARGVLEEFADVILSGDVPRLMELVAQMDEAGKDFQHLVFELLEYFRNLLVLLHVKDPSRLLEVAPAQLEVYQRQAAQTDAARALRVVDVLTDCVERMKYALSRRTLLEVALIRCARAVTVVTMEELLAQVNALRGAAPAGSAPAAVAGAPRPAAAPAPAAPRVAAPAAAPAAPAPAAPADPAAELARLRQEWPAVVAKVGKLAVAVKGALNDARPLRVEAERVTVGFDPEFQVELQRFEVPRNRRAVEAALKDVLQRPVTVNLIVAPPEPGAEAEGPDAPPPEPPAAPPPPAPAPERTREATQPNAGKDGRRRRSATEWLDDPTVLKTLDMFDGTIIDVRE